MGDAVAVTGPTERLYREEPTTVELPRVPASSATTKARSGFWRELAGALTFGLCLLALVVLGVQILSWVQGVPGPGVGVVIGHIVAAVAAIMAQRFADRRRGPMASLGVFAVLISAAGALWFFWWA